ncbi:ABC-type transport system involved in multi-copper enzyme maturation, permease component [Geodermatophilus amargosae]|uniref:ABC-type transport system involved in multi-copper enzyme maturation, permease component n=2 Tax=Geodermatophilus amargosae TaxID=1296565 RepID=A0A1I7DC74_9ACTN|nr:ABC-type transport system involved in multi-copper enzyme maturation, permease component [Geodermatophilus amargosae]
MSAVLPHPDLAHVPPTTTPEMTDPTMTTSPDTTYRITTPRVVRAEWIKLRTLRSTWTMLLSVLLTIVGIGAIAAATATGAVEGPADGGGPGGGDALSTVLAGSMLAVVLVGVLGVLVGAREYSSGLIRSSLAAVPARLPVLWAKVVAFLGAVVPVVLSGVLVAFVVGMAILDGGGVTTVSWSDEGTARVVLGTAAYVIGIGLIGLALGLLLRSTAGAISALLAGVLVLPTLAGALLPDAWDGLLKYFPSNAASAFTSVLPADSLLSSETGALVFAAWIVVGLIAAAVALTRRDA